MRVVGDLRKLAVALGKSVLDAGLDLAPLFCGLFLLRFDSRLYNRQEFGVIFSLGSGRMNIRERRDSSLSNR